MIIFDCSGGNNCRNNIDTALRMVKEIADLAIPGSVIKWQLFKVAGDNLPLDHEVFERASKYADLFGIRTTASVFDKESLDFLLKFQVPFVKIANSQKSRDMLKFIPETMPTITSIDDPDYKSQKMLAPDPNKFLEMRVIRNVIYTISEYPAKKEDYIRKFGDKLKYGISDHTENFDLYKKYKPEIYEFHYKLKDSTGADSGSFARTFKQVQEALK